MKEKEKKKERKTKGKRKQKERNRIGKEKEKSLKHRICCHVTFFYTLKIRLRVPVLFSPLQVKIVPTLPPYG